MLWIRALLILVIVSSVYGYSNNIGKLQDSIISVSVNVNVGDSKQQAPIGRIIRGSDVDDETPISVMASNSQTAPLPVSACSKYLPFGGPTLRNNREKAIICRNGYYNIHDNLAKIPAFAAYTLSATQSVGCLPRNDAFAADQSLPADKRSKPEDYVGTGFDQGHNVPDGDVSYNAIVKTESFIDSNMSPQFVRFNRGIWKQLESYVRAWAFQRNTNLLIYTGSVYDITKDRKMHGVDVPNGFYKIVIDLKTKQMLAFLFPHSNTLDSDPIPYITTVRAIETATGITFKIPPTASKTATGTWWPGSLGQFTKSKQSRCRGTRPT
jgi:endonuclease G